MSKAKEFDVEVGINMLSLDAGSPGGALSQIYILTELLRRLKQKLDLDENQLIEDHLDLIGGSGLGVFVALCIGSLGMSIDEAIDALCLLAVSVFFDDPEEGRTTIFSSKRLKDTLTGIIERSGHSPDAMIKTLFGKSKCKTVLLVSPVVDVDSCHFLRMYRSRNGGTLQCTILDVALASISTTSLFKPAEMTKSRRQYTSAGIGYTNPVMTLLEEAERIYGKEQRISCLMSLGAGISATKPTRADLSWLDVHGMLQAMDIQQERATVNAQRQFGNLEAYFRFSVDNGVSSAFLQDWTHWDSDKIEVNVREYLTLPHQSNELDAAVGCILDRKGTITLNRLNHVSASPVMAKVIPPITPYFVLRKKAWEFMEKNLTNAPTNELTIFLISGMGGCGKSTLFSYYVKIYGTQYSHVFLVDGSSVHNIKMDLQDAVRSLGPEHSQKTWEEALHYFEQDVDGPNKNWLIGFDNVDDPTLPLHEYIPKSDHGTVFITTRNRDFCFLTSGNLHWELGPMPREEALVALLQSSQRASSPSEADLRDGALLVERLGGLALAVVQAGVYCFQKSGTTEDAGSPFTFHQYLDEMDRNHGDLMKYTAGQSIDQYDRSVWQSLNMSYSALPQLTRDFLHLCGYFHHYNISLLMLESAVDNSFQQTDPIVQPDVNATVEGKLADILKAPGKSTTIHLHKFIFSLKMFSLVVTSMTTNSVMLNYHPLVNTWSCDILPTHEQQIYSAMATRVVSTCWDDKYYLVHPSLLPHIQAIVKRPTELELHLNDMHAFARRLSEGGLTVEAEALYQEMHDRCVTEFGNGGKTTLLVLSYIVHSLSIQGLFEDVMEKEREIQENMRHISESESESESEEHDEQVFTIESNLAASYLLQERWSEAEEMFSNLVVKAKEMYGGEDARTLLIASNLSSIYFHLERDDEAIALEEFALKIRKKTLGKEHPDTLISMVNLGSRYTISNRLDEAEKILKEAFKTLKDMNGIKHPDTLMAMTNLAYTYSFQQRHEDAVTLGEQALDGWKRVRGETHQETLRTMFVLATIYFRMDRDEDGLRIYRQLLELEDDDGEYSQALADTWLELAGESDS